MSTLEVACFQSEPNKEFVPQEEGRPDSAKEGTNVEWRITNCLLLPTTPLSGSFHRRDMQAANKTTNLPKTFPRIEWSFSGYVLNLFMKKTNLAEG